MTHAPDDPGAFGRSERKRTPVLVRAVIAAGSRVNVWIDRARQRRFLAQLPERELRDIGISRYDALQEWRKPFWRG